MVVRQGERNGQLLKEKNNKQKIIEDVKIMKKRGKILGYTLLLTLVLLLSACSGNSEASEIDTLTDENTQLRRELDSVQEQLEAAQSEIERLEGELNTAVEAAAEVETPAPSAVLPQMDSKELPCRSVNHQNKLIFAITCNGL